MAVRVSWDQALAWRLERQMLDPAPALSADEVVRRLGGVQAQVASSAELAIRVRQASSASGEVAAALLDGRLIKTWAMRGTLHLLVPDEAGWFLSLLASGRTWELPSWQRYFGMTPRHWDAAPAGGPRGARRRGPHPRGAHRGGHDRRRPRAHRRCASLRVGNAAQAPRLAG